MGRIKSLGCIMDDPRAWVLPRKVVLDPLAVRAGEHIYVDKGCKKSGLESSAWAKFVASGPGLNRRQASELFEKNLRGDEEAMKERS